LSSAQKDNQLLFSGGFGTFFFSVHFGFQNISLINLVSHVYMFVFAIGQGFGGLWLASIQRVFPLNHFGNGSFL